MLMPVKIFCCYAHEDEPLLKKLKTHLFPLQRAGLVDVWYDRDISAGTDWEQQIKERLNTALIILLLVSPDFMASDYCYSIEMQRAIERHEQGEAHVIPIILRPVYWQDVLGKLQALPTDAIPVMSSGWQYQDEAFVNVTEGIRKVAVKVMSSLTLSSQTLLIEPSKPEPTETPATVLKQQTRKPEPLVTPEDFSWHCIRTLIGHGYDVWSVAISADGQTLASGGSYDKTIKLWNLKTEDLLRTLTGHKDSVKSVAISADGQTLASGSEDHTIKLWKKK
jgi:TIR domain/WD domain, G-beta repeat